MLKFCDYVTHYQNATRNRSIVEIQPVLHEMCRTIPGSTIRDNYYRLQKASYSYMRHELKHEADPFDSKTNVLESEVLWYQSGRPYYDCYPKMSESLSRFAFEKIPLDAIYYPEPVICLRFSNNQTYFLEENNNGEFAPTTAALVSVGKAKDRRDGEMFFISMGYQGCFSGSIQQGDSIIWVPVRNGCVDKDLFLCHIGKLNPSASKLCSLTLAIGLLGKDSELVSEIITKKYQDQNLPHDEAVAKSRAKGLYGFSLGKNQEICPHFRADHLCNIAYGPKHSLRKIILRKGGIVKRTQATTVPTGYLDLDQKEGSPTNAT